MAMEPRTQASELSVAYGTSMLVIDHPLQSGKRAMREIPEICSQGDRRTWITLADIDMSTALESQKRRAYTSTAALRLTVAPKVARGIYTCSHVAIM
jgi:hypothetical protein